MQLFPYVGRDPKEKERNDLGSIMCYTILEYLPRGLVTVKDATQLPPQERPDWLKGTPTLYEKESDTVVHGFEAYNRLLNLLLNIVQNHPNPRNRHRRSNSDPLLPTIDKGTAAVPSARLSGVSTSGGGRAGMEDEEQDGAEDPWAADMGQDDQDGEENEGTGSSTKKLTKEDFERANKTRRESSMSLPAGGQVPPPLEPLRDD